MINSASGLAAGTFQPSDNRPTAQRDQAIQELAEKLEIPASDIQVTGARRKMMNVSSLGFPVRGALQMAGAGQIEEYNLKAGDESFIYRGEGSFSRMGLDAKHDGYWVKDARGIYVPDGPSAPAEEDDEEDGFMPGVSLGSSGSDPYAGLNIGGFARPIQAKPIAKAEPAPPSTGLQGTPSLPKADINGEALSAEQLKKAEAAARDLAGKLELSADDVSVNSFKETYMSAGYGFGVQGELMMSGMFQGIDLQLSAGDETFRYRGDGERGRVGIESDHDGWWVKDHRGIYQPDPNAKEDQGGFYNYGY